MTSTNQVELKSMLIKDVEQELQSIAAVFGTIKDARNEVQRLVARLAVTTHSTGDIRPVLRCIEYFRTEAPAGINLQLLQQWFSRHLPAHYSKAKGVWVFNPKKRLEMDDAAMQAIFLDKWFSKLGTESKGFQPIDAVKRLKAQAKAWAKAIDAEGADAGVTTKQLNALLECIKIIEE